MQLPILVIIAASVAIALAFRRFSKFLTRNQLALALSSWVSIAFALILYFLGLSLIQVGVATIFLTSILGTLMFWKYRLIAVTFGVMLLLVLKALNVKSMLKFMHIEVILFLIGMMIVVAYLRTVGFFRWIAFRILKLCNWDPMVMMMALMALAAIFAALVDEVTSILIMIAIIFEICDYFRLNPIPYLMSVIFSTNIGSSATLLGNPVGILLAFEAKLSFEEFLRWSSPVALLSCMVTMLLCLRIFRSNIKDAYKSMKGVPTSEIESKLKIEHPKRFKYGLILFVATLLLITLHSRIEAALGLEHNAMLLIASFLGAGMVFILMPEEIAYMIERHVEWRTLLFFMLLFAQVGALLEVGIIDRFVEGLYSFAGGNPTLLLMLMLLISTILSGFIDNVPAVATLIPVVKGLGEKGISTYPFWWALLYAGTYGGNLTTVSSTANIVALSLLETHGHQTVSLVQWLKIGTVVVALTVAIASLWLLANVVVYGML